MTDRFEQLIHAAGPVSRETYEALEAYEALFRKWNERINLASPSTLSDFWTRHVIDSAQVIRLRGEAKSFLDLGSGGGLPGIVLAVLSRDIADMTVDLVESNRKKTAFLINALTHCKAQGRVHPVRIQDAVTHVKQTQIVTARALAPLVELFDLSHPWLENGARGLFHKGRGYREEIEESRRNWLFDLVEHKSTVDADSVILEISNLSRRSTP